MGNMLNIKSGLLRFSYTFIFEMCWKNKTINPYGYGILLSEAYIYQMFFLYFDDI